MLYLRKLTVNYSNKWIKVGKVGSWGGVLKCNFFFVGGEKEDIMSDTWCDSLLQHFKYLCPKSLVGVYLLILVSPSVLALQRCAICSWKVYSKKWSYEYQVKISPFQWPKTISFCKSSTFHRVAETAEPRNWSTRHEKVYWVYSVKLTIKRNYRAFLAINKNYTHDIFR